MFLVGILSWWYGVGLADRFKMTQNRIRMSLDFFSISLLLTTLFEPFRQISSNRVGGALNVQLQSFFDRLISRFVGAFMRMIMIIIGCLVIFFQLIFGLIILIFWIILPILPIVGVIATTIGLVL